MNDKFFLFLMFPNFLCQSISHQSLPWAGSMISKTTPMGKPRSRLVHSYIRLKWAYYFRKASKILGPSLLLPLQLAHTPPNVCRSPFLFAPLLPCPAILPSHSVLGCRLLRFFISPSWLISCSSITISCSTIQQTKQNKKACFFSAMIAFYRLSFFLLSPV